MDIRHILCYTYIYLKPKKTTPICFQCGSKLILVSKTTVKLEGSRFPQTTLKYRCSNKECQEEIDKQTAKRVKIMQDKAESDKKRADEKQLEKNEKNKLLIAKKAKS